MKKIIHGLSAALLSFAMVCGIMPYGVNAEETETEDILLEEAGIIENGETAQPEDYPNSNNFLINSSQTYYSIIGGKQVTMSVNAFGDDLSKVTYQWYVMAPGSGYSTFIKTAIKGATAASYTTGMMIESRKFICEASDGHGNTDSVTFNIEIENHFSLVYDGRNTRYVYKGENVEFKVVPTADNTSKFYYYWYLYRYDSTTHTMVYDLISDATDAVYKLNNVQSNTSLYCVVYDMYGTRRDTWYYAYVVQPEEVHISYHRNTVVGETQQIETKTSATNLVWKSLDPDILQVDQSGKVKALKAGHGTIQVITSDGKYSDQCVIFVYFTDVPSEGRYYSDSVYWAVDRGITNGYYDSDGLAREFRPQNNCTREAVVTFLWRMAGKPEPDNLKSPFSDVQDTSKYYYKAVLWAAEQGITKGYADGTFKPSAVCLREHVVTFIWRYAGKPVVSATNQFKDVSTNDYYYMPVLWAGEAAITKGYADDNYTTFRPKNDCLREHVVTFLYRYFLYTVFHS